VAIVGDGTTGAYFPSTCEDTIIHFNGNGGATRELFAGIQFGGNAFSDGNHGMVVASSTTAKRFDQYGNMIWSSPVIFLQNPGDAYSRLSAPDNNGGVIMVFWTTSGGVFAQHTGRVGKVGIITAVGDFENLAEGYELSQNFPNPFNAVTKIKFTVPVSSRVLIEIYDILGRIITTLVDQQFSRGVYMLEFDGSNYSTGIYFVILQTDHSPPLTSKLLLIR